MYGIKAYKFTHIDTKYAIGKPSQRNKTMWGGPRLSPGSVNLIK